MNISNNKWWNSLKWSSSILLKWFHFQLPEYKSQNVRMWNKKTGLRIINLTLLCNLGLVHTILSDYFLIFINLSFTLSELVFPGFKSDNILPVEGEEEWWRGIKDIRSEGITLLFEAPLIAQLYGFCLYKLKVQYKFWLFCFLRFEKSFPLSELCSSDIRFPS